MNLNQFFRRLSVARYSFIFLTKARSFKIDISSSDRSRGNLELYTFLNGVKAGIQWNTAKYVLENLVVGLAQNETWFSHFGLLSFFPEQFISHDKKVLSEQSFSNVLRVAYYTNNNLSSRQRHEFILSMTLAP